MKLKFTSHAVERSLERIGMTGVEFNRYVKIQITKGKVKPEKLFKDGIHHYWMKVNKQSIRLTMNKNIIITIWNQSKN